MRRLSTNVFRVFAASVLVLSQVTAYVNFATQPAGAADTGVSTPTSTHAPNNWDVNAAVNLQNVDSTYATEDDGSEQGYSDFNIPTIPAGSTVDGVEVYALAAVDDPIPTDCALRVALSWNDGVSYTSYQSNQLFTTPQAEIYGGSTDTWGRTWVPGDFTNGNFVVKLDDHDPGTNCANDAEVFVDFLRVTVYYTAPQIDPQDNPFVRITYLCQASFDGIALAWDGTQNQQVPVSSGDHIWRIRYESGRSDINAPASVPYSTNFLGMSGTIDKDEILFETTATGANGVNVSTTPQNLYRGTASVSGAQCEEADPEDRPFVRITYLCQASFDGLAWAWNGRENEQVPVSNGDHIWRFRYEGGNSEANAPATVPYSTNFLSMDGNIDKDQVLFETTATGTNGVNVSTTPQNLYRGTASVSGAQCERVPERPYLHVVKIATNDHGGETQASEFDLYLNGRSLGTPTSTTDDDPDNGDYESTAVYNNLRPLAGTVYTLTEDSVPGYENTYIRCFDVTNGRPGTPIRHPMTLENDRTYLCHVGNDDQPASLTVNKEVVNNYGGPLGADDFTLTVSQGQRTAEISTGTELFLAAGQYTVGELEEAGYVLGGISGDCGPNGLIDLVIGESYTCTVTNNDEPAKLIVRKELDQTNGGDEKVTDFQFVIDGDGVNQRYTFDDDGELEFDLAAGRRYRVREVNVPAGYRVDYDNCRGDLVNGVTEVCTITNTSRPARLYVNKVVINNNGGVAVPSDFSFTVNGGNETTFDNINDENGEARVRLPAGTYTVRETADSRYRTTYTGDCRNVQLGIGEEATCTIVNNDRRGRIRVVKELVQDNGGTESVTDFRVKRNNGNWRSFNDNGRRNFNVNRGTHNITEEEFSGYETEYGKNCRDVFVDNGQTVTCRITNDDIPPVVHVHKDTVFCQDQEFDFTIENLGQVYSEFTLVDDCHSYLNNGRTMNGPLSSVYWTDDDFQAGSVSVYEDVPDGWFQAEAGCFEGQGHYNLGYNGLLGTDFTAEIGQEYHCYFTNVEYAEIKVIKFHDHDQDGKWDESEPTLPDWEMNLEQLCIRDSLMTTMAPNGPTGPPPCDPETRSELTDDDGIAVFDDVRPRPHKLYETLQPGWVQSVIYCDPPELDEVVRVRPPRGMEEEGVAYPLLLPGETTYCFVGNHREPAVELTKTSDADEPVQPGTEIEFTLTVTVPEVEESGNLQGAMDGGDYLPVEVVDNLQDEFEYVPDSFTATSSEQGDLVAAGTTTDPDYASPGTWLLTTLVSNVLAPGEVITLTYRAIVGLNTPAGSYPTTAVVTGYGDTVTVVATATDDDEVVVFVPVVPAVLGASTTTSTELANTGSNPSVGIMTGVLLIAAVLSLRRRNTTLQNEA